MIWLVLFATAAVANEANDAEILDILEKPQDLIVVFCLNCDDRFNSLGVKKLLLLFLIGSQVGNPLFGDFELIFLYSCEDLVMGLFS